ncbi:MAG: SIR2 family protein [Lautropia sp.]|nr:SIR2 family protein [Lautropia sp.]
MIDPMQSLAFSVQTNPGVYAVLIGSGVSRSANIPTGWEITLDLVRKLAATTGEGQGKQNPEAWYRTKYNTAPDYSELLDGFARTPSERQKVLKDYIEPTDEERTEGLKRPTPAHHAIAKLVASGHVRVIITTNFDRLMEQALEEVGITPTVISTEDQAKGALPLIHQKCCVFKVHGDYMDTRIRNTEAELASYPDAFNQLLDRILDEFGLITCGWSATWDPALRAAVERGTTRRFSHYWATRGTPSGEALALIAHRGAHQVPITDADSFFKELAEQVAALNKISRQAPTSIAAKLAILKKYLPDLVHRISLDDLVNDEVTQILERTSGPEFSFTDAPPPDSSTFTHRVRTYEAACEALIAMAVVGGYWAEDWHYPIWQKAISRLGYLPNAPYHTSSYPTWRRLQRYPATLMLYALGLGALQAGDKGIPLLAALLSTPLHEDDAPVVTAVEVLPPFLLFDDGNQTAKLLENKGKRPAPLNEWIAELLHPHFKSSHPSTQTFQQLFDRLEVLMALNYRLSAPEPYDDWAPLGHYALDSLFSSHLEPHLQALKASLQQSGEHSVYVTTRLIGTSVQDAWSRMEWLDSWVKRLGRNWYLR